MTPLEIIALFVAALSLFDAFIGIVVPKTGSKRLSHSIQKTLKSRDRWILPFSALLFILIFAYFVVQQVSILAVVPGIFIGVLILKMTIMAQYPDEALAMQKKISEKIDWITVAIDLVFVLIILLAVFW